MHKMSDDEMGVRVGARYDSATPLAAHNGDVGVVRGFCELPGGRGHGMKRSGKS